MRHFPAALALSLAVALTASIGQSAERQPDPRAVMLEKQGEAKLASGDVQGAIDDFEAALAIDPGYTAIYLDLGEAARRQGLHGKAKGKPAKAPRKSRGKAASEPNLFGEEDG